MTRPTILCGISLCGVDRQSETNSSEAGITMKSQDAGDDGREESGINTFQKQQRADLEARGRNGLL